MANRTAPRISLAAWAISFTVNFIAFLAWGQSLDWHLGGLGAYETFPLFGLIAFSSMWSLYAVGLLRRRSGSDGSGLAFYYKLMSVIVLAAIFLHPGLLVWRLWRDGLGLPPQSYLEHYVAPGLKWAIILSTVAWLIFIAYELRHKYKSRSWWKYLEYTADAAMAGIFFHALALGNNIQQGWFRAVWVFYGLVLAACLIDIYLPKVRKVLKRVRASRGQV